jgi:hypothetical protein
MSDMSARLSPPLLSHDIEGSLPEEDGLAFPDRKSSQLELPSAGPDDEFADGFETGDISQHKEARYVKKSRVSTSTYQEVQDWPWEGQN